MLLKTCFALSDFSINKQFKSKKNNVYWIHTQQKSFQREQFVLKQYHCPQPGLEREAHLLQELKRRNAAVPLLLHSCEENIFIEFIEGPLLLDFFSWQENVKKTGSIILEKPVYQAIYSLCRWFMDFYPAARDLYGKALIKGDVNFRNFIIREKIYGVDFEDCREGRIEEDIGRLCAFALTYTPAFTPWKIAMTGEMFRILNRELGLDAELTKKEMQKELLAIAGRRNINYGMLELLQGDLLERIWGSR